VQGLLKNKALILTLLLVVGIAFEFWTGSRYPALDQKAMMAGTAGLEPLGFDTVLVIRANDPEYIKILKNTVNWAKTNQRGMTFGLLFAAALLTLISLFKRKSFEGSWSNSALGVMIGTPLGVCVNCAAPIAQGLHTSGLRLETTLAAMISSPTLNVIVMAMMFSLFPLYMVGLKIGATLLFLLAILPLLSKYIFKEEVALTAQRAISGSVDMNEKVTALEALPPTEEEANSWIASFKWLFVAFFKNLWFIVKTTLPLMILAGFLGSLVVILVPLDTVTELLPNSSILMKLLGVSLVAAIGVFLPVPITFDIIIVAVLMAAGMPVMYGMTLLFTLGIYSVYSHMIVTKAISKKVAFTLYLVIAVLGVLVGLTAREYDQWDTKRKNDMVAEIWPTVPLLEWEEAEGPAGEALANLQPKLSANAVAWQGSSIAAPAGISVQQSALVPAAAGGDTLFTKLSGAETGLTMPYQFSPLRWTQPFSEFRGIASGDIHNDGHADIVATSQRGLYVFANDGGTFVPQEVNIEGLSDEFVFNAALVDLNNDGWLDLFYSTYLNGTYVIYNDNGDFRQENLEKLPNQEASWASASAGFADLDQDGDLDIVLGNWTLGSHLSRPNLGRETSRNVILWNTGNGFETKELEGPDGETLTILVTDFTGDNIPDMVVGNDFQVPDFYYEGLGNGEFSIIRKTDNIIPVTTLLTMSATSADLDNDLQQEIFMANVSGTDHSILVRVPEMCIDVADTEYADECETIRTSQDIMNRSLKTANPFMCFDLPNDTWSAMCIAQHIHLDAWWKNNHALCDKLDGKLEENARICHEFARVQDEPINGQFNEFPDQGARRANVLLAPDGNGGFVDKALEFNLRESGWSWNSRFADLDHDEYQDVVVVNGYFNENTQPARESNHLFMNNGGQVFVDNTEAGGMRMYSETAAYTYSDYDNDGDLDVIMMEALGPVWVFRNNQTSRNSVLFELNDEQGNRFGIGSRIYAYYDGGSGQQMREIQASGGFSSFDAPLAHFGLGDNSAISRIEVVWSTGEKTEISGPFETGNRYRISRN